MLSDGRLFGRRAGCFTLQWHLTNACELECAHCYDRNERSELSLAAACEVVEQLSSFCQRKRVGGHVCFTGGNPILYPHFGELYQMVAERDLRITILGNPVAPRWVGNMLKIRKPDYYQVSLEGLEEHNDLIRGPGHYRRVLEFLPVLRSAGIRANVMLTLTRANLGQVLPLCEALRDKVDRFTFNRLAQVGKGAGLESPTRDEYVAFMKSYIVASRSNPVMGFKDSLFNIARHHFRRPRFGGCTGFGCGAAFNFLAVLPDGQAHACRKLPSPVGHLLDGGLEAAYDSASAQRYRNGSRACRFCRLRNVCGGCLAVTFGQGGDVFSDRDPHCFWRQRKSCLVDLRRAR